MQDSSIATVLSRYTGGIFSPRVWVVILIIGIIVGGFLSIRQIFSSVSRISPTINTVTTPDPTTVAEYKKFQDYE